MRPMNSVEQENNGVCPYCAERISSAAKLCPRCRQWLTFYSFRNPVVYFCVIAVPMFAVFGVLIYAAGNLTNPPPYYSDHKGSLQILKSNMNWVETYDGARLFVTGVLTNQSQIVWKN